VLEPEREVVVLRAEAEARLEEVIRDRRGADARQRGAESAIECATWPVGSTTDTASLKWNASPSGAERGLRSVWRWLSRISSSRSFSAPRLAKRTVSTDARRSPSSSSWSAVVTQWAKSFGGSGESSWCCTRK
jgi:hypothetical protein